MRRSKAERLDFKQISMGRHRPNSIQAIQHFNCIFHYSEPYTLYIISSNLLEARQEKKLFLSNLCFQNMEKHATIPMWSKLIGRIALVSLVPWLRQAPKKFDF